MAFITALVAGEAAAFVAYFDMARIKPDFDRLAGRRRCRIQIGPYPDAAQPVHPWETRCRSARSPARRAAANARVPRSSALHLLLASGDLALFVGAAGGEQLRVELFQLSRFRQRHPVIAPEVAGFAFNPAFFVRFPRIAKVAAKRQCERKAMKRAVSSRRYPCRIFFTALSGCRI